MNALHIVGRACASANAEHGPVICTGQYDYHQNVTEPQATEYHTKSTHMYNTGTVSGPS